MIEQWSKEFFAFCDALNRDWEEFLEELDQFSNELPQSLEQVLQEVETTLTEEFELFWDELVDSLGEQESVSEANLNADFRISSQIEPDETTHPACVGCRHYHGYVYGGNLLVCAMHPYGWYDENCPDWEPEASD